MSAANTALHGTTFSHGVHPPQCKDATKARPIERFPFVDEYVMPLSQHIGAPSVALVRAGDAVKRGQLIAKAGAFVSTTLHAPVTGRVKAVEPRPHPTGKMMPAIVIEADPFSSQRIDPSAAVDPSTLKNEELVQKIQMAGLVGLGGAAFPSHVKLSMQPGRPVRHVVINGCECEPYLTCDARLMAERPQAVLRGTEILMQALNARQGWVAVEDNKPEAIEALRRTAASYRISALKGSAGSKEGSGRLSVEIAALNVKYPQGAEKMLIEVLLGTRVPPGGLPLDIGVLVNNVATTAAMADWFDHGIPLLERVVTVTGEGISRPRNLLVPLGTPVSALVEYCGGLHGDTKQVIMGGPMMGMAQKSLDVPVLKGTSGILAFTQVLPGRDIEYPCIRCGRCLEACPMFLNPTRLAQLARVEALQELEQLHALDCFECGSCSYICPSNIPLVQWIRLGKTLVKEAKKPS